MQPSRNDGTHAASPGFGIVIDETQSVRVVGVYLDYTALRLVDPSHISVVDSFFLGMGTIVVAAGSKGLVDGLMVIDNTWANYNMPRNRTIVVDERENSFAHAPKDMVMYVIRLLRCSALLCCVGTVLSAGRLSHATSTELSRVVLALQDWQRRWQHNATTCHHSHALTEAQGSAALGVQLHRCIRLS
jgi:hypothetical protein